MQIHVGSGIGTGPTTMAAFDSALNEIGIANYNMLRLSSIVPPGTNITVHEGRIPHKMPGTWGDRMYVVMAEIRVDQHNVDAWAGVGWVQDRKTGRGMFTEHEGFSEEFVRREINQTLEALIAQRGQNETFDWGPIQMKVVGRTCDDKPVCALVVVVFQTSDWANRPHFFPELTAKKPFRATVAKVRFWDPIRAKLAANPRQ